MADRDEKPRATERNTADASRKQTSPSSPEEARDASRSLAEGGRRESGEPGGGQGRRDAIGGSKVYPMSGSEHPADAELRTEASWGQGERGAAGYEDSGGSELVMRDGELLGGTTAGPDGRPTIDIHGGRERQAREGSGSEKDRERGGSRGSQAEGQRDEDAGRGGGSGKRER